MKIHFIYGDLQLLLEGILGDDKYSNEYLTISDRKWHLKSVAQSTHKIAVEWKRT